jgi:hypothetical protein
MLFGRAIGNGVTKRVTGCKLFSEAVNIEIFIKNDLNIKIGRSRLHPPVDHPHQTRCPRRPTVSLRGRDRDRCVLCVVAGVEHVAELIEHLAGLPLAAGGQGCMPGFL